MSNGANRDLGLGLRASGGEVDLMSSATSACACDLALGSSIVGESPRALLDERFPCKAASNSSEAMIPSCNGIGRVQTCHSALWGMLECVPVLAADLGRGVKLHLHFEIYVFDLLNNGTFHALH